MKISNVVAVCLLSLLASAFASGFYLGKAKGSLEGELRAKQQCLVDLDAFSEKVDRLMAQQAEIREKLAGRKP